MTVTDAMPRGTNRRTITRTIGSASLMTVVQYAVSLVVAPVVLGQAGVSTFGVWATIASVLAVGALADAGLRLEIGRRVADALGDDDDDAMRHAVHHGTTLLAVIAGAGGRVRRARGAADPGVRVPAGCPRPRRGRDSTCCCA